MFSSSDLKHFVSPLAQLHFQLTRNILNYNTIYMRTMCIVRVPSICPDGTRGRLRCALGVRACERGACGAGPLLFPSNNKPPNRPCLLVFHCAFLHCKTLRQKELKTARQSLFYESGIIGVYFASR